MVVAKALFKFYQVPSSLRSLGMTMHFPATIFVHILRIFTAMNISENARVWIYQSNRALNADEERQVQQALENFTSQWQAHGHQLAAKAEIRYHRFIILMVDESQAGASGCSIDKSVHLMKEIEEQININLFDRFNIAYRSASGEIESCGRNEFEALLASGKINENTMVFNNLVQTVKELNSSWEVPLKNSWHATVFAN